MNNNIEMDYTDKKALIGVVAGELSNFTSDNNYTEWPLALAQGARKLAYWLEQDIDINELDDAQEAICNFDKCANGTDLTYEFGISYYEEDREKLREHFNVQYSCAVFNLIGPPPK